MTTGRTSVHKRHDRLTGAAAAARPDVNALRVTTVAACHRSGCKAASGHHGGIHGFVGRMVPAGRAQRRTALSEG